MLHRHLPHLHHHHHGLGPPNHVLQIKGQIPILLHSEMAPITGEKLEVQVGGKFAFIQTPRKHDSSSVLCYGVNP